jgi:hypothetical protein
MTALFLAFCDKRAARPAVYKRIFTEITFRSQRVNHPEGAAGRGSGVYLQSGLTEVRRSLVSIGTTKPW